MTMITESILFWIVIGAGLAAAFALFQMRSLKEIGAADAQRTLSRTMASSAIRIVISVGILFLAFRTGLKNGLGCLVAFIIARWLWLIFLVREKKINKGEV